MIEKDEFSVGKSTILMDTLKRVISTFDNPPMKEKEPMRNKKQTQNISIDHIIIISFINRIDLMIFFSTTMRRMFDYIPFLFRCV